MATFPITFAPPTVRVYAATAAKGAGGGAKEEKSLLDFILGNLTKQDQFYETDPILKKVEDNNKGTTSGSTSGKKGPTSVAVPQKKKNGGGGGFNLGGLFAKKD